MLQDNLDNEEIQFDATIISKRYYNENTNWGVYTFESNNAIPNCEKNWDGSYYGTLAGKMQELYIGSKYTIKAKYKEDKIYGGQYCPISVYAQAPKNEEEQLIFLKSLVSSNIADNLLQVYPNLINDIINGNIIDIDCSKVKGVGEITWKNIKQKIIDNYLLSDVISLLRPLGVTFNMINKLLEDIPNPALLIKELNKDPYILTRINGIGFSRIDELALKINPDLYDSEKRLIAFIKYYLTELGENEGHTWVTMSVLKKAMNNMVPECYNKFDDIMENNNFLYSDGIKIGLNKYRDIETNIYNILYKKTKSDLVFDVPDEIIKKAIVQAEKEQGFEYTKEQIDVIYKTINSPVMIITGKAGCGKSSIMRAIIKAFMMNHNSISASALSAMAAQRINDATGTNIAATIHRTLGSQGLNKFTYNKDNQMIVDVAYMDEGSMTNATLFLNWLDAIKNGTRIIISGDHKQLPAIGFGNIFSDLIDILDAKYISKLTKPMRQAEKSGILVDANMVRDNINPIKEFSPKLITGELHDMYYMFRSDRDTLFNIAIKMYLKSIETEGIDNVAIVVPRRQGCKNSTSEINKVIQDILLKDVQDEIIGYEKTFKLGARVMQTVNDYDKGVFNGDIGYITNINQFDEKHKRNPTCDVTFLDTQGERRIVTYNKNEIAVQDLAYAMTVHKMQGGGRHTVIGIIDNSHYQLLDNCMLYTLMTRAKSRLLLLAQPQAFMKCIKTSHNRRNTWLGTLCNK